MARWQVLAIVWIGAAVIAVGASRLWAQSGYPTTATGTLIPANIQAAQPLDAPLPSSVASPVLWQQYPVPQRQTLTGDCPTCGRGGQDPYDRCGSHPEIFPWIRGPGNSDQWCVGPHWAVEADGLFLFRDDADWGRVITAVGVAPTLTEQFDAGPGARLFVTGYNESGFGMQVGYEGVNDWNATAVFPLGGGATRSFDYETRFNSLEINFLPQVPFPWKFFAGFRYVQIDEDFADFTVNDKPIPPPANPPAAPVAFVDSGTSFLLVNRLIGFQVGGRRDTWQWNKWFSLETFFNTGVYFNKFRRDDVSRTVTTTISGDDLSTPDTDEFSQNTSEVATTVRREISEVSFLGEAGIASEVRINQSVALRGGYQVMVLDGVGEGLNAFFAPGLNSSTLVYHGLQFGLEYRR